MKTEKAGNFLHKSIILILFSSFLLGLSGCQFSSPKYAQERAEKRNIKLLPGVAAFEFDPKKVEEITIAKTDPTLGEQWIATFIHKNSNWTIASGPADSTLMDRNANSNFIVHLIDSLAALRLLENPMNGPLDAMGLAPPRFSIKWRTSDKEFKFLLGSPIHTQSGKRYMSLGDSKVHIASGSAIPLLDQIRSFEYLRNKTWTLLSPDEVDEIELLRAGHVFFYAQREGDDWTDRSHRPLKKDVNGLLTTLTHTSLENFVENADKKIEIENKAFKKAYSEARLTDRFGKVTTLKLNEFEGITYGINSTRPSGLFILPRTIRTAMNLQP